MRVRCGLCAFEVDGEPSDVERLYAQHRVDDHAKPSLDEEQKVQGLPVAIRGAIVNRSQPRTALRGQLVQHASELMDAGAAEADVLVLMLEGIEVDL